MKEFAKEAKGHGLLYVPIRNKKNKRYIEIAVFADDASKVQRIYDNLGLDFVKAQVGEATVEKAPQKEQETPTAPAPGKTEKVEMENGTVEFEVGGFEDDFIIPSFSKDDTENFSFGQEQDTGDSATEKSLSGNSLPNKSSSPEKDRKEPEQKPSVKKQLQKIKQEWAEKKAAKAKQQERQNTTPGRSSKKKKKKAKGRWCAIDLSSLISKKQEPQLQLEQQYTKEEYAAMKQAEREEVWARVNAQAEEAFRDDASMKGFLNFMAQCTPQSTRNLLLLYEQNPEITHPRTFDKWKEAGRSIRAGEKGYTFFADQEYEKEDGTKGNGYIITKAYDISQTRGQQPLPPQQHLPEELIAAMIEQSPVPLTISDQLPQGVQAQYIPRQRIIYVRNGMDETTTACAIVREQAHAGYDAIGSGYYRQAYAPQAYCATYVVAQKFGLDTSSFQFDKMCQSCMKMTSEEKRSFISDIKRAAYSINKNIQRSFRDLEQSIRPDEFSVEIPKPVKTSNIKEKAKETEL